MPSVKEYITRKERAIQEIQQGIVDKTEAVASGVREIQEKMETFTKAWYG